MSTDYQTSEQTDQLAKALAGLQATCGGCKKSGHNPHFKSRFTTLADAWAVVRPALTGLGLAVAQLPVALGEQAGVVTHVLHESGQWLRSTLLLPVGGKPTAQAVGSAITYARRYSLLAVCGVADDDDDGHAATEAPTQASRRRTTAPTQAASRRAPPARHGELQEDVAEAIRALREIGASPGVTDAAEHWAAARPDADKLEKGLLRLRARLAGMRECKHASWAPSAERSGYDACDACDVERPAAEPPSDMAAAMALSEEQVPF